MSIVAVEKRKISFISLFKIEVYLCFQIAGHWNVILVADLVPDYTSHFASTPD